jgi:hypothetical protein
MYFIRVQYRQINKNNLYTIKNEFVVRIPFDDYTVNELMVAIEQQTNIKSIHQRLIYNGKQIFNGNHLSKYMIQSNSYIILINSLDN